MPNTDMYWFAHRRGVARKEGAQQRDESWDGALLSPDGRRDEEREEGAVLDWHAPVRRQQSERRSREHRACILRQVDQRLA